MDQQGQDKPAIVIDSGSSWCRAGFSGDDSPKSVFPCVVGEPKMQNVMIGITNKIYLGQQAQKKKGILKFRYPIQYGVINNWEGMIQIWEHCFKDQFKIDASQYPCLLTQRLQLSIALTNPKQNRQKTTEIMFQHFKVPSFFLAKQAELALLSYGKSTGLVVDIGHTISFVTPVEEGKIIPQTTHTNYMGGRDLTQYLSKLFKQVGLDFSTSAEMEVVRDVKQKLCYIAVNFQAEMEKSHAGDTKSNFELPDGQVLSIETQKFRCPQLLFKPSMIGKQMYGIHQICYKSIMKCNENLRGSIYSNIVLCGGSSMFSGLSERLTKQIRLLATPNVNVKVQADAQRKYFTWIGGSILSCLATFPNKAIKRSQYQQQGASIVHKKCI